MWCEMAFPKPWVIRGLSALMILNLVWGNYLGSSFQDDIQGEFEVEHPFLSVLMTQGIEASQFEEQFEVEGEFRQPLSFKLHDFAEPKRASKSVDDWSDDPSVGKPSLVQDIKSPFPRADPPLVNTTLGQVQGVNVVTGGVPMVTYKGIPFAEPPVGPLRFMPPVPAMPWGDEPLIANASGSACVQRLSAGSEDCLFLDIYAPEGALSSGTLLPVIVYIHGGAFILGSNAGYGGVFPMVEHGVVLVLPQYRLGVLGFFSTGDDVVPGNQGLQDQTLALRFIRDNIASFGGDPDRLSLMGTSAGAVSSHFQLLAPSAAGLFNGAILLSGTVLNPWATGRDYNETAHAIARTFLCRADTSEEIVLCLQDVNAHLLDDTMYNLMDWNFQPFKFAPRVDGTYIPGEPAQLLKDGNFTRVPVVMGTMRDEGALESTEMYFLPSIIESLESDFDVNGPISLMLFPDEDPLNTAHTVYDRYINGNITEEKADNLTLLYTDRLFHVPLDWTVELMASHTPTYVHELHHRGERGYCDIWLGLGLNLTAAENWISHGDDIQYTMRVGRNHSDVTSEDDLEVRRILTTMWADFARTGSPTPDDATLGFQWPAITPDGAGRQHLKVTPTPSIEPFYRADTRAFWGSLPLRMNEFFAPAH